MTNSATNNPPSGPLVGLKVIDFSSFIAGGHAAMTLGDYGADIIKVESLTGDASRGWGPHVAGESRPFQGWNRNKRSIALNLKTESGLEIIYRLLRTADVVVENYRPGITTRLKIDYDSVRAVNPEVIYCSISGFGSKGPDGKRPGYDPLLQALSGTARANGWSLGKAAISSVAVSDYGASLLSIGGILAALYHRERTGQGQRLETSLLQAVMTVQSSAFCKPLDEVEEETPPGIFPYTFFETKDSKIFIAGGTDKFWQLFCRAIGADELADDPDYHINTNRVPHAAELTERILPYLRQKTTVEWEAILLAEAIPCAGVRTFDEFFLDPQVEAMDMNPVIRHGKIGRMRVSGVPIHFSETPGAIQRAAPMHSEHADAILTDLGYDRGEIDKFRTDEIVK